MKATFEAIYNTLLHEVELALNDIGGDLVRKIYKLLRDEKKYATMDLMNSIVYDIIMENETTFALRFGGNVEYLKYVHEGRVPGKFPPYDPAVKTFPHIKSWIETKRLETDEKKIKRVTFAIALKLKEKGTEPFPFLRLAVQQNIPLIRKRLERLKKRLESNG